jgi:uncharacterized membrane protein YccC
MKVAAASVRLRDWLLKRPDWLDQETVLGLVFGAKTFAASLLALYIAFWAGLDDPRWALLTVYVVSQPDSGLVLAKSFYRVLGTIAGMLFATALVSGLAQYGELFMAALALWIGVCAFAARGVKGFARYGFQLAGYTVAIVGIPAALNPRGAYPLVVARCTEIMLGILCAAVFSRLIFVRELSPKLVDLVCRLARRADSFATAVLDHSDHVRVAAERTELAKLTKGFVDVQEMQYSAFFESPGARVLHRPLRRLTQAAVELCALTEAAANRGSGPLAEPQKKQSAVPGTSLPCMSGAAEAAAASALIRAADERDIGIARARLRESMAAFDRGAELPGGDIRCTPWLDPLGAALTGIRSSLAVGIISAFWFVTSWPTAPTAIVVAAVLCTLLAPMEEPDKLSIAAGATILVAATPVFATEFYLMPLAVDFLSMAVAIAPLMLVCAFLMAQPRIGVLGLLGAVYFAFATNIDNVMTYDAGAFLNSSFAILIGVTVAAGMFATVFPETPAGAVRRFRKQLITHLDYLLGASPDDHALPCYQAGLYEQLGATVARVGPDDKLARECFASATTGLSAVLAISRLRRALDAGTLPVAIASKGARLLARLSQTLRTPSSWRLAKRAAEAHVLARDGLMTERVRAKGGEIEALNGIVVGAQTLSHDLLAARMILQETLNAR